MIPDQITRALIVRQPWIELILSGQKTWEMRSTGTSIRGRIGLIEQGTGLIVGECSLDHVGEPIDRFNLGYGHHLHKVDDFELLEKWRFPWVLSGAVRYKTPIEYSHPKGAVIWVKLNQEGK